MWQGGLGGLSSGKAGLAGDFKKLDFPLMTRY
jgi:hypothetical protein